MATALTFIQSSLRKLTAFQSGDQLPAMEANDCLEAFNDMLDAWSTDENSVYGSVENIVYFNGLSYQYTIGIDPTGATVADFSVERPLRITNAFTRITTQGTGYDYPITIGDQDNFVKIGLKSLPYPWPTYLWYNPTFPFGQINFFGNPVAGGELHLFTDTILANLTLNSVINLPQGYSLALKWNLAKWLCLEFGFPLAPALEKLAKESYSFVKALNAQPIPESSFDRELLFNGPPTDAGGILYGWYR
jgi:hypothetical protein